MLALLEKSLHTMVMNLENLINSFVIETTLNAAFAARP